MIAELGHFSLWLALALAFFQAFSGLWGAARADMRWMLSAQRAALIHASLIALAFTTLAVSFINHDFSLINVAHNSNSQLPLAYRIAATWGSHEGSLLLWALMLGGWTAAVATLNRSLPRVFLARVLGTLGLISVGFLAFTLLTSNPFLRQWPVPTDGRDLNPLLQDPGMVIHPPMLYMGYVGFSVAFAFAIAAMLGSRFDAAWTRWTRPWTIAAWSFLTLGIALGSAWAYYELGWGGWWFWDPVENASFMPWLLGTALMHSLIVTERRGGFKAWTLLLAIASFSLSLLGTFLVRSGVLTSVHAFATDPTRGVFILIFLVLVVGGSLTLYAWRAPHLSAQDTPLAFKASSREGYLLINNLLLATAAGSVLLGTLYPLVLDTLGLGKISVGPPYFEAVFVPLMAPAAFLMGVGPLARWRTAPLPDLATRLKWAFLIATITSGWIVVRAAPNQEPGWVWPTLGFALGIFLGLWLIAASLTMVIERVRNQTEPRWTTRLRKLPGGFWGMIVAHIGVGVFCIGVASVNTLETELDVALNLNQPLSAGAYTLQLTNIESITGPNYEGMRAHITVTRGRDEHFTLTPEKRRYIRTQTVMTEAAIDSGLTRDVYVALGESLPDGRWTVRVWLKPFVDWIWAGCFMMALGGLIALADRRYRHRQMPQFT